MFDWDEGNINKNLKHSVHDWEIEEACQDPRAKIISCQIMESEKRYILLGRTSTSGKYLRIVYALKEAIDGDFLIRPISAVEMNTNQRRHYQKK